MPAVPSQAASELAAAAAAAAPQRNPSELFTGKASLRWPTERRALALTLLCAPLTLAIIGFFLPEQVTIQQVATLIVVAMVYVTIARGRLLGTSIRAHEGQLPELHAVVKRCARMLGLPMPHVFVREDLFVCITGMGLGQPYALALSSQWLPHLEEDELTFLVGAELAHIAGGHTRLASLFSASGKENPLVALVFGAWLRRTEYTADRVGLLCCGSMDPAVRAIFKCSFHPVASKVSYTAFSDQRRELEIDPSLKMGEWLGEAPYAVNRLRELAKFTLSPSYAYWNSIFESRRAEPPLLETEPEAPSVPKNAGLFQRSLAFFVDYIVVSLIVSGVDVIKISSSSSPGAVLGAGAPTLSSAPSWVRSLGTWLAAHGTSVTLATGQVDVWFALFLYCTVLVAFTGRTFGMMIFGLRVVRNDLGRVGAWRAGWRYFVALVSVAMVIPLLFGLFRGRFLHDRLSGTRVIRGGA